MAVIKWQNDPLLLDPEPTPMNVWLTANKLLEKQAGLRIYLQLDILNLYSIMIRKIDFQSGKRLLQRLPYITLPDALAAKISKKSLLLAERCHHYFQDTVINYSIKKWQQKIIDYLENQKRLPFPMFRLSDHWQEYLVQEYVPFQSARGEQFHVPTRLTSDLAYFLGVVIGDGHLNYHNIELVDFSKSLTKEQKKQALYLFKELLIKSIELALHLSGSSFRSYSNCQENKIVLYDRGGEIGNSEVVFTQMKRVLVLMLNLLTEDTNDSLHPLISNVHEKSKETIKKMIEEMIKWGQ